MSALSFSEEAFRQKLNTLKLQYKASYDREFDNLLPTLNHPLLSSFTPSLLKAHHKDEVTTLLACGFSLLSNDGKDVIFRTSIMKNYPFFEEFVEDSIQFGRAIILLDKHNNIAAVRFAQDMCDRYQQDHDHKSLSHMPTKLKELYDLVGDRLYDKDKEYFNGFDVLYSMYYRNYQNLNELESLYGTMEWGKMICVREKYYEQNLAGFLCDFHDQIALRLGCKYQLFRTTHPTNMAMFRRSPFASCLLSYDYRDHVFADGSTTNDRFDELQRIYGYDSTQIDQLKRNCKLEMCIVDLTQKCAYTQGIKFRKAKL